MEKASNSVLFEYEVLTPDSEQELLLFEKPDDVDAGPSEEVGTKSKLSQILVRKAKYITETEKKKKVALKKEITPLSGIGFVVGQLVGSGLSLIHI